MNGNTQDREDVVVFWDFETSASSSSAAGAISTYEMVKNIRSAVAAYGPLKSIRLYWDYGSHPVPSATLRTRSELSASGVSLIDCPAENRKGAVAKKMLVDMIFHAWDTPLPFIFVIITGDRDVAYALAKLRMKSYRVVLISPAGSHPDLTSQASDQLDWSRTILGMNNGSNGEPIFLEDSPNTMPASTPAPARSSDSPKPGQETFTFRSAFPPTTLRGSPGLAHKSSAFSSAYGLNVFGGPRFSSPKSSFGLGDGPLFPRPSSADQKPLRSRAGSLPDFLRPTAFTDKGKQKTSGPEDIELQPPQPPSGSKLRSIFEPFDDDDRQPSPGPAVPGRAWSSSSSESRQSKFSFEQIPKPTEVDGSELVQQMRNPIDAEPARLSNEPRAVGTTSSAIQTEPVRKPPTLPPPPLPPQPPPLPPVVARPGTSTQSPNRAASTLPRAWLPLIRTLRKHNGVLLRSKIAPKLLKDFPDAFKTAGLGNIKEYLAAAIKAGIVLNRAGAAGKNEIQLKPPYL